MSALRIECTLTRAPEHRVTSDGQSIIDYHFTQAGRRAPLVGTQRMGQGPAAQYAASNKAHALARGMAVTVHAAALERDAGGEGIRIMGIDHVEARVALALEVAP